MNRSDIRRSLNQIPNRANRIQPFRHKLLNLLAGSLDATKILNRIKIAVDFKNG